MDTRKRMAFIRIPAKDLIRFLGGGGAIQCAGMPGDAEVVAVDHCFETNCFKVMLRHPQFYPTAEGHHFPCIGTAEFVALAQLADAPFARES